MTSPSRRRLWAPDASDDTCPVFKRIRACMLSLRHGCRDYTECQVDRANADAGEAIGHIADWLEDIGHKRAARELREMRSWGERGRPEFDDAPDIGRVMREEMMDMLEIKADGEL